MAASSSAKTDTQEAEQNFNDDISAELIQIRQDIAALGKTLGTFGKTRIGALPDAASKSAEETLENAKEALKEIRREVTSLEHDIERRVSEHPMQSLVIALGLGFLAAYLFRR